MSPNSLPRILLLRWPATVAGLLLTLALVAATATVVKPTYQANANVLLVPPAKVGTNPYLDLGGLEPVADILARSLADDATAEQLKSQGFSGTYTVSRDQSVSGPVLLVTAETATPASAMGLLGAVLSRVAPRLASLQQAQSVAPQAMLTLETVYETATPKPVTKSRMRAEVAAGILGLVVMLALVLGTHRLKSSRAQQRVAEQESAPVLSDLFPDQAPRSSDLFGNGRRVAGRQRRQRGAFQTNEGDDNPSEPHYSGEGHAIGQH